MTAQEFITRLLLEKYELAAICTVLSFLVIFYVLKKKIHSVIDPLLLSAVSLAFSISVALFLFLCGEVDKEKITYFVIGQTLFLAIIYIVFPNRKKLNNKCVIKTVGANTKMLFVICFLIFIFVSLYSFSINGIPLFQTTRYDVNIDNSSGILGFLSRMKNSVVLFIAIYKWAEFDGRWWTLLIAILIPTLFEGLRDEVIGTDMLGYGGEWFYSMNEEEGLMTILESAQTPEYAYHLLIYVCKKISQNINVYMTACALIKMSAVTLFVYRMREQLSSLLFLFSYYCFFYVTSFSMMRQGIAVAICIYSLYYLSKKDILRFLPTVVIAYFFHNSAILMLLILPIYYMRNLKYKYYIILGSIVFVYFSIEVLFELVLMTPLFKSGMADLYIDSGVPSAKTNILISLVFLGYGVYYHYFEEEEPEDDGADDKTFLLLITSAMTLMFLMLASYIEVAFRMSYYMFIVSVAIVIMFISNSERYRYERFAGFTALFLLHFYIDCGHGLAGALD